MVRPAIEVEQVGRVFTASGRRITALDRVSFTVEQGQIVGLLGENGAGKTTLTKILSTLLLPTAGTARILGVDVVDDPRTVRASQSVILGGDRGLYNQLSARENLRFFGMLDGLSRRKVVAGLDDALDRAGLGEAADRKVGTFSKGMRQRLHIAIGMLSEPAVLLLDEPTVGLDPVEADRLRGAVRELRGRGVSILLTSHYLLDIEELADRVVVLEHGRVSHDLTVAEFSASLGFVATVVVRGSGAMPAAQRWDAMAGARMKAEPEADGGWRIAVQLERWSPSVFADLGRALQDARIESTEVVPARLEDAFIHLQREAA
jgi:ABC-2 type transport system ATP-binding protein